MSQIKISNLSFSYDNSYNPIFDNVSLSLDTNWKLGLIGRNGKGKTTFLKLLMGKYDYKGMISSDVSFDYFPFEVVNPKMNSYSIAESINSDFEEWKLQYEVSLLGMDLEILDKPFENLSKGEQTRILLAVLFIKNQNFLLIDEPTNHLDMETREVVANYLNKKRGFILVSHDRQFLDNCVDHILSINRVDIEIQQGNFSSWWINKTRKDNFELTENEKIKKEINRLEKSSKQASMWSNRVEASKKRDLTQSDNRVDKGFIGRKAEKMAQRAKNAENRRNKELENKSKLLKNIESLEKLKLNLLQYKKNTLLRVSNLSISYDKNLICDDISFDINIGDRVQLVGQNGSGKSSILKLILGDDISYSGEIIKASDLQISYVSQDTSYLKGNLSEFALNNNIDETLFKSILHKLDFSRVQFDKKIEDYSEGQKKKVLLAKSLSQQANLYIWDEPLNYIDVFSRVQIENVILEYCPTMIFVEHDQLFSDKIATKKITIDINKRRANNK